MALAARGLCVTLFAGGDKADPRLSEKVDVVLTGTGAIADDHQSAARAIAGVWDRRTYELLVALLRSKPRDGTVVHAHSWGSKLSPSVFSAVRAVGLPLVITAHDYLLGCPNACRYVFPVGEVCGREPLSMKCLGCGCDRDGLGPKVFRAVRFASQSRALRALRPTVVYVSGFQEARLERYIPIKHNSRVIENPVSASSDLASYTGGDGPFLCAGRLEPEKGMDLFCRAASAAGVPALVVGDGSMRRDLMRRYPEIEFRDWMTAEELSRRMLGARALVFPSRWLEAAPLTPIEAQLVAALPCIVSDVCAARESVQHGITGLVFESGNVDALESCIRQLEDRREHARMRQNVVDDVGRVRALHSQARYADELTHLYQEIVQAEN